MALKTPVWSYEPVTSITIKTQSQKENKSITTLNNIMKFVLQFLRLLIDGIRERTDKEKVKRYQ